MRQRWAKTLLVVSLALVSLLATFWARGPWAGAASAGVAFSVSDENWFVIYNRTAATAGPFVVEQGQDQFRAQISSVAPGDAAAVRVHTAFEPESSVVLVDEQTGYRYVLLDYYQGQLTGIDQIDLAKRAPSGRLDVRYRALPWPFWDAVPALAPGTDPEIPN